MPICAKGQGELILASVTATLMDGKALAARIRAEVAGGNFRGPSAELAALEQEARQQGSEGGFAEVLAAFGIDAVSVGDLASAERYADRAVALTSEADAPWPVPVIYYSAGRTVKASPLHALFTNCSVPSTLSNRRR